MTGWTITVKNETLHDDVVFLLFVDNTNLPGYFTNIFFRSPTVGPGGSRDIEIDPKLYGVCGIAQGSLKPGISVRNAQPRLLRANPDQPDAATCSAVGDGFVFTEEVTSMSVLGEGQIGLKVSSFSSDMLPHAFVGYGKAVPNDVDIITPVLTTQALPSSLVILDPKPAFLVASIPPDSGSGIGEFTRGVVVAKESFGQVASVEFTKQPVRKNAAEVTLHDGGTFQVQYVYHPRH